MAKSDGAAGGNRMALTLILREIGDGQNLPFVVRVTVRVAGNLLALGGNSAVVVAERVSCIMRVQQDAGILMFEQ